MGSCHFTVVFILGLPALFSFSPISATAHYYPCSETFSLMTIERNITHCKKLSTLGFEFGWNYHNDSFIDIFVGARLQFPVAGSGWMAWGVNPHDKPQMVGTRAIIGIRHPNGSLIINTYNITRDIKLGCKLLPSKIDVEVLNMKFNCSSEIQFYTMFATLVLSPSVYNISRLNHVWQTGYAALGSEPMMHPSTLQNVDSSEMINLRTGKSIQSVELHRRHLRTVHGILNILGWGMLLPIGVIIARYLKNFPIGNTNRWMYLHIAFQIVGYTFGTIGWAIGLWLGRASEYYTFRTHRFLAMCLFTFTTIQILALRLRPKHTDEYRKYWNMYHHFLGYALLILITVNIFEGIHILRPNHTWKKVYIGLLLGLLVPITLAWETYTWFTFIIRKKKKTKQPTTLCPVGKTNRPSAITS